MKRPITRREFLAGSAAAAMGLTAGGTAPGAEFKTTLKKALIGGPDEGFFRQLKEAGFDGLECTAWNAKPADAAKARALAEKTGVRIHSVLRGWLNLNVEKSVAGDLKSMETALAAAAGYGADTVLTVPCHLGDVAMPQPWEFDIDFDEKTAHVRRVVQGDNEPYQKYIEGQNHATDTSREALNRLIPTAEKAKVIIAVENVWNNLWVDPRLAACFVKSLDSPWVGFYFDIGNHVKYFPPQRWIATLGKLIVKCHVKDFKLKPDGHGGNFVDIRDGSVDWPVVRAALDKIGYIGWMTIEVSGELSKAEQSELLDLIIAGK